MRGTAGPKLSLEERERLRRQQQEIAQTAMTKHEEQVRTSSRLMAAYIMAPPNLTAFAPFRCLATLSASILTRSPYVLNATIAFSTPPRPSSVGPPPIGALWRSRTRLVPRWMLPSQRVEH